MGSNPDSRRGAGSDLDRDAPHPELAAAGPDHGVDLPHPGAQNEQSWGDRDIAEVEVLLKEYETLRQESLNALNNRSQVTAFGLGAIGVLAAGAFNLKNEAAVLLVFNGAIPLLVIFTLTLWMDEVERARRAGRFLANTVEQKVERKFGHPVLTWEGSLQKDGSGWVYVRRINALLLAGILVGSPLLGVRVAGRAISCCLADRPPEWWLVGPWAVGLPALWFLFSRFRASRHGAKSGKSPGHGSPSA
jgi:hypothetical protein